MAKPTTKTPTATPAPTATDNMPLWMQSIALTTKPKGAASAYQVQVDELPVKTIQRLLENGFSQMIGDVGALTTEQKVKIVDKALAVTRDKEANPLPTGKEAETYITDNAQAITDWTHDKRMAKVQAMLDGTLGETRGPQRDPVERKMEEIAEAKVLASAAKTGIKLTKEQLAKNTAAVLVKYQDDIRAEAIAQLANMAKGAEDITLDLE